MTKVPVIRPIMAFLMLRCLAYINDAIHEKEAVASTFIRKPIGPEELTVTIREKQQQTDMKSVHGPILKPAITI
jgi:hypothetical protein